MLKRTWKALVYCAVVAATFATQSASAGDGFWRDLFSDQSDCIQFTATEEALFIGRDSRVGSGGGVVNGPDSERLGFDNADFNHEFGYRVSIGIQGPEKRVEAIFSDLGKWNWLERGTLTGGLSFDGGAGFSAGANQLGLGTFFQPLFVASLAAADETDGLGPVAAGAGPLPTYDNFYTSQMQDLQINVMSNNRRKTLRIGIGYRNVQLDEVAGTSISGVYQGVDTAGSSGGLSSADLTNAGLTFISGVDDGFRDQDAGPGDQLTLSYNGNANNDLNGFQFITDVCLVDRPRFNMSIIGKAGAYHNHTSGRVRETYTGTGPSTSVYGRELSDTKDTVAFVGGVAVKAGWRLTDRIEFIGGYEGTFVSGVALAPEQASGVANDTYQVNTDGNVIVHGANFGLQLTY